MKRKIDSLTSLRFWMMMFIIISHFEYLDKYEIYNRYFHGRYVHVALIFFFVISGFGLAYSNKDLGEVSVKNSVKFAVGRIKKIWLLYVTLLVICIPYCIYLNIDNGRTIASSVILTLIKFLMCLTLLQSATGISTISHGINSVSWFLSTLFIIYLFAPIILKLNKKIIHTVKKDMFLFFINLLFLAVTYKVFVLIESRTFFDDLSYGSPYIRIFAFIAGVLIADLVRCFKLDKKVYINIFEILVIVINIFWILYSNVLCIDASIKCVLEIIICCMLVYVCTLEKGFLNKILSNKWNVKLGQITMYLYLIHYPVRLYIDLLWEKSFTRNIVNGVIESCLITIITFVIVIFISKKSIRTVENKEQQK